MPLTAEPSRPSPPAPAAPAAQAPGGSLALRWLWLYVLLLAALCPEIFARPATRVIANHGDGFNAMLWWFHAGRGEALKPWTSMLFHPFGVDLAGDKGHWLLAYLTVPLQWLLPLPVVYNLSCVLFFATTAWGCAWAAREAGAGLASALAAGALLVLSPAYLCELSQGSTELTALGWLLAFVALAERARSSPESQEGDLSGGGGLAARTAGWLVAAALTTSYHAVYAGLCCLVLPVRRLWRPLLLAGCVLVAPLWLQARGAEESSGRYLPSLARQLVAGSGQEGGAATPPSRGEGRQEGSLGPAPAPQQLVELDLRETRSVLQDSADLGTWLLRDNHAMMSGALPTCVLVVFAGVGVLRRPRACGRWGALALLCLLLSLGPALLWKGRVLAFLPTEWLYAHLPLLVRLRACRFLLPASLALALCAAHALPTEGQGRWQGWLGGLAACLLVAMELCEAWSVRHNAYRLGVARAEVPAWYHELARTPGGAVLEAPCRFNVVQQGKESYYQVVHRHPAVGYDFMRPANRKRLHEACLRHPLLAAFWEGRRDLTAQQAGEARGLGIRWMVLHGQVEHQAPQVTTDDERDALFDPALMALLRARFGEPRLEPGGLWVFDAQAVTTPREGSLTQCSPVISGAWEVSARGTGGAAELQAWARGRGGCIEVWRGGALVTQAAPLADDDWHWVPLPLPALAQGERLALRWRGGGDDGALDRPLLWEAQPR